jgi:3-methyl-2-oxobutanoate hydroxymethyltransferase
MPNPRLNSSAIQRRKGAAFPVVTAYDAPFARIAEAAGIDVILVGDSLGMVVLGYESTAQVDLADMLRHAAAAARGAKRAHIIVDLPFGSYEASDEQAVRSAVALVKDGGATSVKLEGGVRMRPRIAAIVAAGIPVVAHIGVTPQTAAFGSGFRRQSGREALLADAHAIVEAGAFAVVLEMIDADLSREITEAIPIPTIGIGSGPHCDGQVLVLHDLLGIYEYAPPFVRRFGELGAAAGAALGGYAAAVRAREYPILKKPAEV